MKTSLPAFLLALLVLCGAVSAQEYQIRAGANINLRDSYSLDGDVVETVPSGSILQVVGQFNRWLKIDRNGSTLWMADWVSHSRLTGGDQAPTRTSTPDGGQTTTQSQIDNCCFVDRQCSADAEWTSGYWAFQNGQCAAPLQSGLQLPVTTTATDSSGVNNCCFIGWPCNTDAEWEQGYWAFQNSQCDHPGIIIEGSETFVLRVEETLDMLQDRAPEWYAYVIRGLQRIREIPGKTSSGVRADTGTYVMGPSRPFRHADKEGSMISLAGGMVHEACHVFHWQRGFIEHSWQNELPCLQVQLEVTEAIDPLDRLSPWLRDLIANIENPDYWWWTD